MRHITKLPCGVLTESVINIFQQFIFTCCKGVKIEIITERDTVCTVFFVFTIHIFNDRAMLPCHNWIIKKRVPCDCEKTSLCIVQKFLKF